MALVHVYPVSQENMHTLDSADCYCEPRVVNVGVDLNGKPARVFVHQRLEKFNV